MCNTLKPSTNSNDNDESIMDIVNEGFRHQFTSVYVHTMHMKYVLTEENVHIKHVYSYIYLSFHYITILKQFFTCLVHDVCNTIY